MLSWEHPNRVDLQGSGRGTHAGAMCKTRENLLLKACLQRENQFYFIYLFLERGVGREKERERNIDRLPLAHPRPGTWPSTQTCALTGNQTGDLLVLRPALSPLSHISQGKKINFKKASEHWVMRDKTLWTWGKCRDGRKGWLHLTSQPTCLGIWHLFRVAFQCRLHWRLLGSMAFHFIGGVCLHVSVTSSAKIPDWTIISFQFLKNGRFGDVKRPAPSSTAGKWQIPCLCLTLSSNPGCFSKSFTFRPQYNKIARNHDFLGDLFRLVSENYS